MVNAVQSNTISNASNKRNDRWPRPPTCAVDRAIRNCPYSIELVKGKLKLELAMANAEITILMLKDWMTKLIVKETQRIMLVLVKPTSWRPSCVRLITSTKRMKQLVRGSHCAGDRVHASPTPPSTAGFLCSPSLEGTAARQYVKQRIRNLNHKL